MGCRGRKEHIRELVLWLVKQVSSSGSADMGMSHSDDTY